MIRVAIVDDHPAVRLGLKTALRAEPGLIPVGSAERAEDVAPLLYRTRPDVVLLDYHLPRRDGLVVCCQIKAHPPAPTVLLYTAYADASLVIPALIAGADGILPKNAPSPQLFETIHLTVRGGKTLPTISTDLLEIASGMLDPEDLPILGMLVNDVPRRDIADALALNLHGLGHRIAQMLNRLKAPIGLIDQPITRVP